ncbi:MAG: serine/threonine-protein kinase [Planctomycetota bacterium]
MRTNQCDRQGINEFLQGESVRIEADLAEHLETCDDCRDYMLAQTAEPELWTEARELLRPTEFDMAGTAEFSVGGNIGGAPSARPIQAVLDLLAPSDDPHRLGRLGCYEISGVVGAGGMGVVLKAIDPSLDRVVALKVLAPHLANNETARRRFAREAKAAAAVLHPNVVPIHSVSSDGSVPFLVMAYVRGGSLQRRLENEGPLTLLEILRIGSQIAEGLAAAHDQGLVHRDIKPENVLLEEGVERVTITDFGLARAVDDNTVTQHGTIAGTPMYMSPEQAAGKKVDQQSDLFSLGSVLYALCTGRPPYCDDSSYGVMRQIIDESPTPIEQVNPEIPHWLVSIIEKLMAKEKSDRFTTAAEVHDLLERCLSHAQNPTANPLPTKLRKSQFNSSRNYIMRSLIAGSVLTIVTGLFAVYAPRWAAMNENFAAQRGKEVRLPLSRLDSYIGSMMNSPYELVFLNLGSIGENENYVGFKPIDNGVAMSFPAYASSAWSQRQGKYADKLKEVAQSLTLTVDETSEMGKDGSVKGVNFMIRVTGDTQAVADTVEKVISRTFDVSSSEECRFDYSNLPSTFSVREAEKPRTVSSKKFVDQLLSLERIYLGENENFVFAIPPKLAAANSPQWDSTIWCTDLRKLQPDVLERIRWTQANAVRPNVNVASYSDTGQGYSWQLMIQKVAALRIRLLHISDGKMHVASQSILRGGERSEPTAIDVQLDLQQSNDDPKTISSSLDVSTSGLHLSRSPEKPITVSGPFQVSPVVTAGDLAWGQPTILFHRAVWDGDLSYQRNTDSMVEASKQGADFIAVEVEWIAKGTKSLPEWAGRD